MDPEQRRQLEAAGYVFGDFADLLGLDDIERKMIEFRADLGSAIRRLREGRGQTPTKFARAIGLAPREVIRLEIGEPDISIDLMLKVYFTIGGLLRYEFDSPVVPPPAEAKPARARKAARPIKA